MRPRRLLILSLLAFLPLIPGARADDDAPEVREFVFVPESELDALLGEGGRATLLDWAEYEELRRLAKARDAADPTPPAGASGLRSEFSLRVADDRVTGAGMLQVIARGRGPHRVAFETGGLNLRDVTDNGKPAVVGIDKHGTFLLVEGEGEHVIRASLSARIQPMDGDGGRFAMRLPAVAFGFVEVALAGRQEIETTAPARRVVYPKTADTTVVGLRLGSDGEFELSWRPRRDLAKRASLIHADIAQASRVSDDVIRTAAVVTYDVHRSPMDFLWIDALPGSTILDVRTSGLTRWSETEDGSLRLEFDAPFEGRRAVRIDFETPFPGVGSFDLPRVNVSEVSRVAGRVAVEFGADLRGRVAESANVRRVDDRGRGAPRATYAWSGAGARIGLRVDRPAAERDALVRARLTLSESRRRLDVLVTYAPGERPVYEVRPRIPADYVVVGVSFGQSDVEKVDATWDQSDDGTVVIRRRGGILHRHPIHIRAERSEPTWLDPEARSVSFAIPRVDAGEGVATQGVIAVDAFEDFDVADADITGLEPISVASLTEFGITVNRPVLAYRFRDASKTAGTLNVTRVDPKVTASVVTLVAPERGVIRVRARIDVDVLRAGVRTVRVRVDGGHGEKIRLVGGVVRSASIESTEGGVDVWRVELDGLRRGVVPIGVVLDHPIAIGTDPSAERAVSFRVPSISVLNVAAQSGWIAVESSPGLRIDCTPDEALREIEGSDVPVAGLAAPAHGFVRAYRWVETGESLSLEARAFDDAPVLRAVALGADLVTRVAENGRAVTRARFVIRNTDQQFLSVDLHGGTLWSARVADRPVKPARGVNGTLRVPIPTSETAGQFAVVLVYESTVGELSESGELALQPPAVDVAGTTVKWSVHLPEGYEAIETEGAFGFRPRREAPVLVRWFDRMLERSVVPSLESKYRYVTGDNAESGAPHPSGAAAPESETSTEAAPPNLREPKAPPPEPMDGPVEDPSSGAGEDGGGAGPERSDAEGAARETSKQRWQEDGKSGRVDRRRQGKLSLDLDVIGGDALLDVQALGAGSTIQLAYRTRESRRGHAWFWGALTLIVAWILDRRQSLGLGTFGLFAAVIATGASAIFDAGGSTWDAIAIASMIAIGISILRRVVKPLLRGAPAGAAALLLVALFVVADPSAAIAADSEENSENVERVFVPYDPSDPSTLEKIEKVFLPHERFVELWNRAHPEAAVAKPTGLPVDVVLTGAIYDIRIARDGGAILRATFGLYLPRAKWVEVPLPLSPLAVGTATLDGEPTRLGADKAGLKLLVKDAGAHELVIEGRIDAKVDGPRGRVELKLPATPRARLEAWLPGGGLEADVLNHNGLRRVETEGVTRVLADLGTQRVLVLVWGPSGPRRADGLDLAATTRTLVTIDDAAVDLTQETTLTIAGGTVDRLALKLSAGLVVRDVAAPSLLDWSQTGDRLELRFRPALPAGRAVVRVVAGGPATGRTTELPTVGIEGLRRETGVVGVHAPDRFTLVEEERRGLVRVGFEPGAFKGLADAIGTRRLAYRFERRPWGLRARLDDVARETHVTSRLAAAVMSDEIVGELSATIQARGASIHGFSIDWPAGVEILEVEADGALGHDVIDRDDGSSTLIVDYGKGLASGSRRVRVAFRNALGDGPIRIPSPRWPDVDRVTGTVLVGGPARWTLVPSGSEGLRSIPVPADAGARPLTSGSGPVVLAFRHETGAWSLSLRRDATRAWVRPMTTTRLRVEDDRVVVDTLALFTIRGGASDTLRVFVPEGEGDEPIWQIPGLRRRSTSVATIDGVAGRVHTIELQAPRRGIVPVRLLYERPAAIGRDGTGTIAFRAVRALGDDVGRAFLLVENASDLNAEATAADGLTEVMPSALPFVPDQAAAITHAWSARRDAWSVSLELTSFRLGDLAEAIVTQASLVTAVGRDGWMRHRMTYRILNRSLQYLDVRLPRGAWLQAALVDGVGVKPSRPDEDSTDRDRRVLVPLRRTAVGEMATEVVLVYADERRVDLSDAGTLKPSAPELVGDLPLAKTDWELWLPEEYEYSFDGNLHEDEARREEVQRIEALEREKAQQTIWLQGGNLKQQTRALEAQSKIAKELEDAYQQAEVNLARDYANAKGSKRTLYEEKLRQIDKLRTSNRLLVDEVERLQKKQEATGTPQKADEMGRRGGKAGRLNEGWTYRGGQNEKTPTTSAGEMDTPPDIQTGQTFNFRGDRDDAANKDLSRQSRENLPPVLAARGLSLRGQLGLEAVVFQDFPGDENTLNPSGPEFFNDEDDGDVRARFENLFRYRLGAGGGGGRGDQSVGWTTNVNLDGDKFADVEGRAGLLSIDVPLPKRGRVYRFWKENGAPELEIVVAQPGGSRRWIAIGLLVAALLVLVGYRRLDATGRIPALGAWTLIALGLVLLIVKGAALGLLALVIGVPWAWFVRRAARVSVS